MTSNTASAAESTHGSAAQGGASEPSLETTTITIPQGSRPVSRALTPEEEAAVAALPADSALLVAFSGANAGARFLLDADVTSAGRHPDADIFLDDVTVSRRHVEFRRHGQSFELVDMGSLNGTYVNQDRVDALTLRSGMEVQIGKFRLTFLTSPAAAQ
ncbi:FHA domain-containing protein [Falsarthrobacter nasiphocae]|uniref:PSer/pThr/pTyr-binding forkhead associated (FHA) protein n=1 Tax=Falsarthrobacter nasiphocae TaxID=189863 RepID=A0AAE3YG68_9MICC|nr:FHA domain-containing protein [Falsarthrobacter nasiphocae]MDR6891343.1 pSer/pThr/pTyr-binding forkhead associated (FHA) protein [Falsarthrobacter nasiphocae]